MSKRTVPSRSSAVNLSIADPESVAIPTPISVTGPLSPAIPEMVIFPIPVYAGVKSMSG